MNPATFNQPSDHAIRQEQMAFARSQASSDTTRRPTLTVVRSSNHTQVSKPQNNNAPKGHEAFLKGLENSAVNVEFVMASSGEKVIGVVKTSDKYTVSVMQYRPDGSYKTRVLFKHDISEFSPQIPAPSLAVVKTEEKAA